MRNMTKLLTICGLLTLLASMLVANPCTEPGSMRRVVKTNSGKFEYVIFEFNKPANPQLSLMTERPPFEQDGSGDPVSVKGNFFKVATFNGVVWTCDIREDLSARTTAIRDVKSIGQFEGTVSYAVGYGKRNQFVSGYWNNAGRYRRYYVKFRK